MNAHRAISKYFCTLLFTACALAARAQDAPQKVTVHLDPAATQIRWKLSTALHTVHGTFALKGGLITFDPQTGVAQGEVLVDVASGKSGSDGRDKRMHSEVLESTKYPDAIFHPETVQGEIRTGAQQNVTVKGTFTIHGSDHPLELTMSVQMNSKDAVATMHFVVPYVAWGMKDPSSFMTHVGKQVDVDVVAKGTVEGLKQP
jgi:polyisoprenoid-binding protein YceI